MAKSFGIVLDKSFGSNPYLSGINVYVSDEKGVFLKPLVATKTDSNGKFSFDVDNSTKFISARLTSDNIITKPFVSNQELTFDFSSKSKATEIQEVVVTAKRPITEKKQEEIKTEIKTESKPDFQKKKVITFDNQKEENLFLKYLPHGLIILGGILVFSAFIKKIAN